MIKTFSAALVLSLVFVVLAGVDPQVVDDTFITFQYATNLVEHGRLTWWREGEMVDGFTILGHTLLIAAGVSLGATAMAANMVINLIAMIAILLGVGYGTKSFATLPRISTLVFTALSAPFIIWYARGLDGILFAATLLWIYLRAEDAIASGRLSWSLIALLALLPVVRPEGLLISPAVICWLGLHDLSTNDQIRNLRPGVLLVAVAIATLLVWRVAIYGYPLPNTFYAKASASRWDEVQAGYRYVWTWIRELGGFVLVIPMLGFIAGTAALLRSLFIIGIVAIAIVSGGDSHAYARFLLPVIPLIALDLAALLDRSTRKIYASAIAILAAYLGIQTAVVFARTPLVAGLSGSITKMSEGRWPYPSHEVDPRLNMRAEAVRELDAALAPGVPVVGTDVGALAYFSDHEIIDAAGLNDKTLAHLPKPDGMLITWGYPGLPVLAKQNLPLMYLSFPSYEPWSWNELVKTPSLCSISVKNKATRAYNAIDIMDESYLCASMPSKAHPGGWINFYVHKDHTTLVRGNGVEYSQCVRNADQLCRTPPSP
ncbi:hypothetical protein ACW9UR_06280 [Halovulum sp. GXIMD14794]